MPQRSGFSRWANSATSQSLIIRWRVVFGRIVWLTGTNVFAALQRKLRTSWQRTVGYGGPSSIAASTGFAPIPVEVAGKLTLLGVYSDPARDPRGHTCAVVYLTRVRHVTARAGDDAADVAWVPLTSRPKMAFDHVTILRVLEIRSAAPSVTLRPVVVTYHELAKQPIQIGALADRERAQHLLLAPHEKSDQLAVQGSPEVRKHE